MFEDASYGDLFDRVEEVKAHRDAFVDEIAAGDLALAALFERAESDPALSSMKVLPAIEALPETGKVSTRRSFDELGIDEAALIGDVPADSVAALPDAIVRHSL